MTLWHTNLAKLGEANVFAVAGAANLNTRVQEIIRESRLEFRLPAAPTLVQVFAAYPEVLASAWNTLRLLSRTDGFQTNFRRLMNEIAFQSPDFFACGLARESWNTRELSREERRRLARAVEISCESNIRLLLVTALLQQMLPSPLIVCGLNQLARLFQVPRPCVHLVDTENLPDNYCLSMSELCGVLDLPLLPSEPCLFAEWPRVLEGFTQNVRASISPDAAKQRTGSVLARAEHLARGMRRSEPAAAYLDTAGIGWIEAHQAGYLSSLLTQTYAALAWFTAALRSAVVTNEQNARKKNAAEEEVFIPRCDTLSR